MSTHTVTELDTGKFAVVWDPVFTGWPTNELVHGGFNSADAAERYAEKVAAAIATQRGNTEPAAELDPSKTPSGIANEIVNALSKDGTISFVGLNRPPSDAELWRAIVHRAIDMDRAQRG